MVRWPDGITPSQNVQNVQNGEVGEAAHATGMMTSGKRRTLVTTLGGPEVGSQAEVLGTPTMPMATTIGLRSIQLTTVPAHGHVVNVAILVVVELLADGRHRDSGLRSKAGASWVQGCAPLLTAPLPGRMR